MRSMVLLIFIFSCPFLGAINEETRNIETRDELIASNLNYLKNRIQLKIQSAESKLEEYRHNLNNSQNGSEVQFWLKKIQRTEKKILNLNDALLGFGIVENRINN